MHLPNRVTAAKLQRRQWWFRVRLCKDEKHRCSEYAEGDEKLFDLREGDIGSRKIGGERQHSCDLSKLRWLSTESADSKPTLRTSDGNFQ